MSLAFSKKSLLEYADSGIIIRTMPATTKEAITIIFALVLRFFLFPSAIESNMNRILNTMLIVGGMITAATKTANTGITIINENSIFVNTLTSKAASIAINIIHRINVINTTFPASALEYNSSSV